MFSFGPPRHSTRRERGCGGMLNGLRRRQTLASFDYQWGELARGDAMLSDPWFVDNVDRVIAEELLGVERGWFRGRRALDAGCGGGRWTLGLLRLGCRVLAVDASALGLESTRTQMGRFAPDAIAEGRLETAQVDLLDLPEALRQRRFDLVFAFGVLHHTGHTRRALANLAPLVGDDGLIFLYLYGTGSTPLLHRAVLGGVRLGLAPLPFAAKTRVLRWLFPARDTHQAFDLFSPLVNDLHDLATVEGWLREEGLAEVVRTIDNTNLFLRASREACSARPFARPATPPYWFERYKRR